MNYRCPSADCAGSTTTYPEAVAQAMGMKCPVCHAELKEDTEAPIEVQKDSAGGPWTDWPAPVSLPLCEYFEEEHPGAKFDLANCSLEGWAANAGGGKQQKYRQFPMVLLFSTTGVGDRALLGNKSKGQA